MSSVVLDDGADRRRDVRAAAVSHHAALRWLQRVDGGEPRPAERVAEAFARAAYAGDRDQAATFRDPETGALLVVAPDGGVRTVLVDGDASGAGRAGR